MIYEALLVVRAYSPYDSVDKDYRARHPIPITARGVNCLTHPYGIAADLHAYPKGTTMDVPGYGNSILVDDCGGSINKALKEGKETWIEIRFPTEKEAKQWGVKRLKVKVIVP